MNRFTATPASPAPGHSRSSVQSANLRVDGSRRLGHDIRVQGGSHAVRHHTARRRGRDQDGASFQ